MHSDVLPCRFTNYMRAGWHGDEVRQLLPLWAQAVPITALVVLSVYFTALSAKHWPFLLESYPGHPLNSCCREVWKVTESWYPGDPFLHSRPLVSMAQRGAAAGAAASLEKSVQFQEFG